MKETLLSFKPARLPQRHGHACAIQLKTSQTHRSRTICVQPGKYWHCFEGNLGETAERWGRAHMGLSEHYDAIFSWNWRLKLKKTENEQTHKLICRGWISCPVHCWFLLCDHCFGQAWLAKGLQTDRIISMKLFHPIILNLSQPQSACKMILVFRWTEKHLRQCAAFNEKIFTQLCTNIDKYSHF